MSKIITKTDERMAQQLAKVEDGDPKRANMLNLARTFKKSWLDLAEALTEVDKKQLWKGWGFPSLESYTKNELHLKPSTVTKLLASFRYLRGAAPSVLQRVREKNNSPIPSMKVVNFVAKAVDRGAADQSTITEMTKAAFDEGVPAEVLSKRYKKVAFPVEKDSEDILQKQLIRVAKKLTALLAHPDLPLPHQTATDLETSLARLLEDMDGKKEADDKAVAN